MKQTPVILSKMMNKLRHIPFYHKTYGRIYMPLYKLRHEFVEGDSNLYNEFGEKLEEFFIRDRHDAHQPYRFSRYFTWNYYNIGLKTHFYSHEAMLQTMGKPNERYGYLVESEAITPRSYLLFDKYKGLEKDFDAIFTYADRLLNKLPNARFAPFCAMVWNANMMEDDKYKHKNKDISILSSAKAKTEGHKFRLALAKQCKDENLADTFGTFDGGKRVDIDATLADYRYSFCIENDISSYFFTERLTSALASQTIPIYYGATKIDEFFNPDGIIKLSPTDDLRQVLRQCTKEEYERRLPAVLDNYERVKKYIRPWDMVYQSIRPEK